QYIINTLDWIDDNHASSKERIDQARMDFEHHTKDILLKLYSRQEEIKKQLQDAEVKESIYEQATNKLREQQQLSENSTETLTTDNTIATTAEPTAPVTPVDTAVTAAVAATKPAAKPKKQLIAPKQQMQENM